MRGMIGCAGLIVVFAFVLGCIGSLFAKEATLGERLMIASMTAAIAFIAAVLLFSRDYFRLIVCMKSVRRKLLARDDITAADFVSHLSDGDATLIAQTRRAIAKFFDVPESKIHPADNLQSIFAFDSFEPGFHTFVVFHVLAERGIEPRSFTFDTGKLVSVIDLANEIDRVLKEWSAL